MGTDADLPETEKTLMKSIEDSANLPEPHVLAEEIADDLRASLEQIERCSG